MNSLLSVVIPVRNEAQSLPLLLDDLAGLRVGGAEVIVVDGGSSDATCELARAKASCACLRARARAADERRCCIGPR